VGTEKKKCYKGCGRDARIGQRTCRECHAEYMRGFRVKRERSKLRTAFLAGFEALRAELISAFTKIGKGEMNGYTAREIVKNSVADVPRDTPRETQDSSSAVR